MTCSSLRNIQEILLKNENKNFWYQKLAFSPFKAYSHIIYRSNGGLGKNTVILISFEFGQSGIHVLNCSYLIKLVRREKPGSLLKHFMLNIFNLKEVKQKKRKACSDSYIYCTSPMSRTYGRYKCI